MQKCLGVESPSRQTLGNPHDDGITQPDGHHTPYLQKGHWTQTNLTPFTEVKGHVLTVQTTSYWLLSTDWWMVRQLWWRNRWPWTFYYHFSVTSAFAWVVQHRCLFCHTSTYSVVLACVLETVKELMCQNCCAVHTFLNLWFSSVPRSVVLNRCAASFC
jgi:hypothetical protein